MTVSCEIERIFPQPIDFTITLGCSNGTGTVEMNNDGSYKGIADIRKTLNINDHNQNVTCEVTPGIGIVAKVTQTLKVQSEYIIVLYFQNFSFLYGFMLLNIKRDLDLI